MIINTARFGEIQVEDRDILHFEKGIPGFEDCHRFVFVEMIEHAPFSYLQSVDKGELSFILTNPFEFFADYDFELPETVIEALSISSLEDVDVRVIVSIPHELDKATANLVAPIVVNRVRRAGRQVVLAQTNYTTRHSLFRDGGTR